jgi:spoIIIJ-associated protein
MASDRKVVHDTINEIEGLATRSEGEEPRRYVVISPQSPAAAPPADDSDEVEAAGS